MSDDAPGTCGCRVEWLGGIPGGPRIIYCPTHAAAFENAEQNAHNAVEADRLAKLVGKQAGVNAALLAALKEVRDFLETASATAARRDEPEIAHILSNVSFKMSAAITNAEGESHEV